MKRVRSFLKRASAIPSGNYTYLFEEEKPAGYDQVLQLTAFNGATQTAAIKHTNTPADVTDSNVQFEVSADISGLTLKPDEIYTIAIINKPQKTVAQFDTNIDSTTTAVADNAKFAMQKTTRHAEGNMEVLDVTDIYTAHFRTSSYSTFSEKMHGISKDKHVARQVVSTLYDLISNTKDLTAKPEVFDDVEYNLYDKTNNLIILVPDYPNTPWYTNTISPLLYTNKNVVAIVSGLKPPTNDSVVTIGRMAVNRELSGNEVETGAFSSRNAYGSICNTVSKSINKDFYNTKVYLANHVSKNASTSGVEKLLSTSNLPSVTPGNYPILAKYKLPGKSHVTRTKQINIEYKY